MLEQFHYLVVNVFQYGESMLLLLGPMLNQDLHLSRTDTLNTHCYH